MGEPAAEEEAPPEGAGGDQNDQLAAFEGLKGKAEEGLQRQRDEETKKQNEHNLNVMSLKQAVALAENKLDDAKKDHARISQEKHEAEGEMAVTQDSMAADEKALASVTNDCNAASATWTTRQSEAAAEMA